MTQIQTLLPAWCTPRRLSQLIFALLLLFTISLATPHTSWATADTVVYDGNDTHCGDACCQKFTITVNHATDTIDIQMWNQAPAPYCFDYTCWTNQGNPNRTYTLGRGNDSSVFRIAIDHTDPCWVGPFPRTITVWICAPYVCFQYYQNWGWETLPDMAQGTLNPLYEGDCKPVPACSTHCSYITVSPDRGGTYVENCRTNICFHNQTGSTLTSFVLNFNPPVNPTNPCPGPSGGPEPCSDGNANSNGPVYSPTCWTVSNFDPVTGNVTFSSISCGVNDCDAVCVSLPRCVAGPYSETITLVNPSNAGGCDSTNSIVNVALKTSDGHGTHSVTNTATNSAQNYPNPLEASTGFKTIIPFSTTERGNAAIHIVDATGKLVLKDNEEVSYAGRHFFYFSAEKLSAGTYYYTIEFPKGVVIEKRTMLVVK